MSTRVSAELRTTFRDEGLRLGLAAAALVLAMASRGDAFVLFALVAALSTRPTAVVALAAAAVGASWRWGSSALIAWSGDQAVLGAAGLVGPATAAAASWAAGAAVLLAVAHPALGVLRRDRAPFAWLDVVQAVAAGVVAGLVVAGPAPGHDLATRALGLAGGTAAALGLLLLRARFRRLDAVAAVAALVAGAASVGLALAEAPAWSGTVEAGRLRDAGVLAVAIVALVVVLRRTVTQARPGRWVTAGDPS